MKEITEPIRELTDPFLEPVKHEKITGFQLLLVILSAYVLLVLILDAIFRFSPEVEKILSYMDNTVCAVFLVDFFYRLSKAESKLRFMKWGWIDLLASIPTIDALRWGVGLRILRACRILRGIKSAKLLFEILFQKKVKGAFASIIVGAVVLTFFSAIAMVKVERGHENANIKTADDSMWWAIVTVTTVGYGDRYPVSPEGRIIAGILMVYGIGLFGTATGYIASKIMDKEKCSNKRIDTIEEVGEELMELRKLVAQLSEQLKERK